MDAIKPVDRLTFEINDDEVCVKNCGSDAMWSVAPLSKIHGFVKAELEEELWASRHDPKSVTDALFARHDFYLGDKNGEVVRTPRSVLWYHIRKW